MVRKAGMIEVSVSVQLVRHRKSDICSLETKFHLPSMLQETHFDTRVERKHVELFSSTLVLLFISTVKKFLDYCNCCVVVRTKSSGTRHIFE
jgi:hypothetical protein